MYDSINTVVTNIHFGRGGSLSYAENVRFMNTIENETCGYTIGHWNTFITTDFGERELVEFDIEMHQDDPGVAIDF